MAATIARAFSPASPPTAEMVTSPLSSMLILAPVASWIPRMVLPLGPMTSPILSGLICIVRMRGACWESSVLGPGHLEVHVAEVVLGAQDVGEHRDLVAFLDQAHGDAGARRLHRDAGIH